MIDDTQQPNWVQKPAANRPAARYAHGMVYDAARGEVVLFGGGLGGPPGYYDTWVWNGTNWTQKYSAQSPRGPYWYAMAYDDARSKVVLFGGWDYGIHPILKRGFGMAVLGLKRSLRTIRQLDQPMPYLARHAFNGDWNYSISPAAN